MAEEETVWDHEFLEERSWTEGDDLVSDAAYPASLFGRNFPPFLTATVLYQPAVAPTKKGTVRN